MNIFLTGFWILSVLCAILYIYTRTKLAVVSDAGFVQFQRAYLVVYLLAMAGDWLQGPHVYALYESYNMSTHQIEVLFVAGFGSSMIIGTVVGSFADKYGRRANCILYGILYGLACVTKHFNNFYILMVGRFLGGMATSILYSAFESWLVYEHHKLSIKQILLHSRNVTAILDVTMATVAPREFDSDLLGNIFSNAILGNSLVAILAGLVAQYFADMFGFVAPFDVSICVLVIMIIILIFTWSENYGDKNSNLTQSFSNAFHSIKTDPKVLCLGLIQSLFEGSMYVFVLEWTPALTPHEPEKMTSPLQRHLLSDTDGHRGAIPHGHIFAAFMVSVMFGSSVFKLLCKFTSIESFMRVVLLVSAVTLLTPVLFPGNQVVIFTGFLVFEMCVGIFWPSLATMRGKYVPEETRATIMNFFRIPLNLIVVAILLQNLPMRMIFQCCVFFLLLAAGTQHWLYVMYEKQPKVTSDGSDSSPVGQLKIAIEKEEPLKDGEDLKQEIV